MTIKETKFIGNYAGKQGGAIDWNYYEPRMDEKSIEFTGNKAKYYGDKISCISQRLVKLPSLNNTATKGLRVLQGGDS